ncbi:MAG: amino acid ABC transporter substrate-binding protein, partial [Spirochaetales bacterium]|nr:amino acid ABC transporter substrate-binding protein [Spirochaetales bacterium]
MKRIAVLGLIIILGISLFAAGSKEQRGVDDSLDKVMKKGKFIMALDD